MKRTIVALPATYARGGTSRAVIFRRADLPADTGRWKTIFQSVLGSPDPESNQLDGLGGGITSLSKVAVVGRSTRPGIDVDYYFVQIDPATGDMLTDANCGNISSAIGPFALDEGWVTPGVDGAHVRIFNENTGKLIVSSFNPDTPESEFIEISGVAGSAMPITLRFEDPASSMGRGLFPTGSCIDTVDVLSGNGLSATMLDVTLPCVIVAANTVGINGDETYATLLSDAGYVSLVKELRVAAALRMGLCGDERYAREVLLNVPDVVVVSPPPAGKAGVTARFVSCDRPHRAAPVTSSMALAAACKLRGTVAAGMAECDDSGVVTIHHPSGTVDVNVELDGPLHVTSTSIRRTSRRIMQGEVLVPFVRCNATEFAK